MVCQRESERVGGEADLGPIEPEPVELEPGELVEPGVVPEDPGESGDAKLRRVRTEVLPVRFSSSMTIDIIRPSGPRGSAELGFRASKKALEYILTD